MYIGKLAKLTGASPKAIRLYESIGLIPIPSREGKYRIYSDKDVALVHMIRRVSHRDRERADRQQARKAALRYGQNQFARPAIDRAA